MQRSSFFLVLWLVGVIPMVSCQVGDISVGLNEIDFVMSPGFPLTCCSPQSVTIRVAPSANLGYIRMTFDDIDLPQGSRLEIFDDTEPEHPSLFPVQPELIYGVWTRPVVASSKPHSGIHIRFQPSNESSSSHVGYKARVWVTNSPPDRWHDKPITDDCLPVASPLAGERVTQKALGPGSDTERIIDCVWQIKVPDVAEDDVIQPEKLQVYARITHLSFTGYLDVLDGSSSEGTTLLALSTPPALSMANLSMPNGGYISKNGLYIHLSMLNKDRGRLEFIYGIFHSQQDLINIEGSTDPHLCDFGGWGQGFLCVNDTRCIPDKHKCNQVNNCRSGEDEQFCNEGAMPEPTKTTTTTTTPTTSTQSKVLISTLSPLPAASCGPYKHMCQDGTCERSYLTCRGHGGRMCSADDDIYCPHLGRCKSRWSYPCMGYCHECGDKSCSLDGKCPGECKKSHKHCDEGCVPMYDRCGDCDSWQKKCRSGQCILSSYMCPEESSCPPDKPYRCNDRKKCYSIYDKCDSGQDCNDGSDEWGCPSTSDSDSDSSSNSTALWVLIIIPIILIGWCIACVCKEDKKKSRHTEFDSQEGEIALAHGEVRSGIDDYTGTRMVPSARLPHSHSDRGTNYTPMGPGMDSVGPSAPYAAEPEPSAPPPSYDEVVVGDKGSMPPPYISAR